MALCPFCLDQFTLQQYLLRFVVACIASLPYLHAKTCRDTTEDIQGSLQFVMLDTLIKESGGHDLGWEPCLAQPTARARDVRWA
jgi:hypothetical protein